MTESAQILVVCIDHSLEFVVKLVWTLDGAGGLLDKVDDHALGTTNQLDQVVRDKCPYVHGERFLVRGPAKVADGARREMLRARSWYRFANLAKRASLNELVMKMSPEHVRH
jgi:hypothetical protein